jgi:hypothetical protein
LFDCLLFVVCYLFVCLLLLFVVYLLLLFCLFVYNNKQVFAWLDVPLSLRELHVSADCFSEEDLFAMSTKCQFEKWPFVNEFASIFRCADNSIWTTTIQSLSIYAEHNNFLHASKCRNLKSLSVLNFVDSDEATELISPLHLVLQDGLPLPVPRSWKASVTHLTLIGNTSQTGETFIQQFQNLQQINLEL